MRRVGCGICQRGMQEAESILIGSRRIFLGEQEAEEIQTEDQLRAALIRPGDTVTVRMKWFLHRPGAGGEARRVEPR